MPRHYQYRTLRSDFIEMCDGNRIAALMLDYFWQQGQKLVERQMNGSKESYIPVGWNHAIDMTLMPIGKNAVKRAVAMLVERGYVTPHRNNGQWGANVTNRYRVEMATIQADINRWSESEPYVQPDLPRSAQTYPLGLHGPTPMSAQTYPLGLAGPQESVKESAYESASSSPAKPAAMAMAIDEIDQLIHGLLGRRPTKVQQQQMINMLGAHRPEQIRAAVDIAAANDKRSLAYVRAILENQNGNGYSKPAAQPAPERRYFVAPEEDGPALTAEEAADIRERLKAIRSAQS